MSIFDKSDELEELEKEYEKIMTNSNDIINLDDLERDILKISSKINKNVSEELKKLQEKHKKELNNLNSVNSIKSTCPVCKQDIKNENLIKALTITYKNNINNIVNEINNLKKETQELVNKKKVQTEKYNIAKTPEMQKLEKLRNELKQKMDLLREEKSQIDLKNREITIKREQIIDAKNKIETLEQAEKEINALIEKDCEQLKIATRLNLLMIESQIKKVEGSLNKVTMEFSKVDEKTGEIIDVYNIKYAGREYEKLSRSYKLRADLEISQLINKVTGINSPVFIDDAESITNFEINSETQLMIAIVIKYNELEILYSYPEVLNRQKESINKKIQESSNYLRNAA